MRGHKSECHKSGWCPNVGWYVKNWNAKAIRKGSPFPHSDWADFTRMIWIGIPISRKQSKAKLQAHLLHEATKQHIGRYDARYVSMSERYKWLSTLLLTYLRSKANPLIGVLREVLCQLQNIRKLELPNYSTKNVEGSNLSTKGANPTVFVMELRQHTLSGAQWKSREDFGHVATVRADPLKKRRLDAQRCRNRRGV